MILVNGRLVSPSAYRPSTFVDLEDTVEWWGSLATLGGLLIAAGVLVGAGRGETVATLGVTLFLATAVLAGTERTELGTAFGVAGVVWTAAGMSLVLGTDPSLAGSLVGFLAAGGMALVIGTLGAVRAHGRLAEIVPPISML